MTEHTHTHTQSRYNNLIQKNHSCHYLKDESMWMDMYWGEESVEHFMNAQECVVIVEVHSCGVLD